MAKDDALYPGEYREHRRAFVARYGHFRVDRLWYRSKLDDARVYYDVIFEVDATGEFDFGGLIALRGLSHRETCAGVPSPWPACFGVPIIHLPRAGQCRFPTTAAVSV